MTGMGLSKRLVRMVLGAGVVMMLAPLAMQAQTCTVGDTSDSPTDSAGPSLRYCVNNAVSGETINFSSSIDGQTILLNPSNGPLLINSDIVLSVAGPGANQLTISGGNAMEVFDVDDLNATVSISGLTIANGNGSDGGGVLDFSYFGSLTVSNCAFIGNTAHEGGAIVAFGDMTVSNSTFAGNVAADYGGAIANLAGTLTVTNSTFAGNTATGNAGGGIYNTNLGTLTLTNSTFQGNASPAVGGGGIYNAGTATVGDTLFSGNSAPGGGGGAIYAGGTASVNYSMFSADSDECDGGGGCPTNGTNGNQVGVSSASANLAPVGWYGGTTQTVLPLPGSAALCSGTAADVPGGVTTDQRGAPRSNLTTSCVDIGAVQTNYLIVSTASDQVDPATNCPISVGGTCSLRDAITEADTLTSADIAFAPSVTGTLGLTIASSLTITGNLNLVGPGANNLTISGGGPVLTINSGAVAALSNITLAGGSSSSDGGGIYNAGSLTISGAQLQGSTTTGNGGGIANEGAGTLMVLNSTISGNSAVGNGGGVYTSGAAAVMTNSTASGNSTSGNGGGVDLGGGNLVGSNLTVSANTAPDGGGGGIYNGGGSLTVSNSLLTADSSSDVSECGGSGCPSNSVAGNVVAYAPAPALVAALAWNGGPTQTQLPLPGSGLCLGLPALDPPGLTSDQRGFARLNASYTGYSAGSPCLDAGAVQTNYQSAQFTQSTYNGSVGNPVESPDVVVSVTENNQNIGGVPVPISFSGTGTATLTSPVTTVAGSGADFSPFSVDTMGSDMLSVTIPVVGSFSIGPVTANLDISLNSQTIDVTQSAPSSADVNSQFNVSATASSGLDVAITTAGNCTGSGSDSTTITMGSGSGNCYVYFNQAGNGAYGAAPQVTEKVSAILNQTIIVTRQAPSSAPYASQFQVSAYASSGLPVTITSSGSCSGGNYPFHGSATITVTASSGTCYVYFNQAGDYRYTAAPTITECTTATKANTNTSITAQNPNPSVVGQSVSVHFSVSAANPSSGTPGGTVTVSDSLSDSCTGSLSGGANGSCTLPISAASARNLTLTATYNGNSNFNGSTSRTVTQQVVDFGISASPSSRTITRGNSTTYTITLTPDNGFAGSLGLSCSGNPSNSTCSISSSSVSLNGSGSRTATVTIQTHNNTQTGARTITLTGKYGSGNPSSGGLTHSTTVGLTVNN